MSFEMQTDIVCITETWLQQHHADSLVAINGYNLIRRDRKGTFGGGICMYVKDSIAVTVLEDLESEDGLEVLWVKLRPTRLPRGLSNIIVGLVYHPPKSVNSTMLNYLTDSLTDQVAKFSTCGLVVLGDLNQLVDRG